MTQATSGSTDKLEVLARLGYGARGVVYLIVGWMAATAAFKGGETTGTKGSLEEIVSQPMGEIMLGVVALGLIGYSIWRLVQGITDTDNHGTSAKGLAIRGGLLVSAVTHVSLALFAASLIFGWGTGSSSSGGGSGGGGSDPSNWTADLMSHSWGRWLVLAIGLAIIGAGVAHIIKGVKAKFEKYLAVDLQTKRWVSPVCRFGLVARGIVFIIIGGFFAKAAIQYDPQEAKGLDGVLDTLQSTPWLLGILGLGLLAFGIYSFVEALYRRIDYRDEKEAHFG